VENLFCYLRCRRLLYPQLGDATIDFAKEARSMYETFIAIGSEQSVNVSVHQRSVLQQSIYQGHPSLLKPVIFMDVFKTVTDVMRRDSFPRFKQSKAWNEWMKVKAASAVALAAANAASAAAAAVSSPTSHGKLGERMSPASIFSGALASLRSSSSNNATGGITSMTVTSATNNTNGSPLQQQHHQQHQQQQSNRVEVIRLPKSGSSAKDGASSVNGNGSPNVAPSSTPLLAGRRTPSATAATLGLSLPTGSTVIGTPISSTIMTTEGSSSFGTLSSMILTTPIHPSNARSNSMSLPPTTPSTLGPTAVVTITPALSSLHTPTTPVTPIMSHGHGITNKSDDSPPTVIALTH
jgi:hypothetical protein